MKQDILVLHGPNLNLLGQREPTLYGQINLDNINDELIKQAKVSGYMLRCFQSNNEAELIERIQQAKQQNTKYILFNPAAFTHTSVALRDAILSVEIPFIEIHISNIFARESFRKQSFFSDIAAGVITGLGPGSYQLGLSACIDSLEQAKT